MPASTHSAPSGIVRKKSAKTPPYTAPHSHKRFRAAIYPIGHLDYSRAIREPAIAAEQFQFNKQFGLVHSSPNELEEAF